MKAIKDPANKLDNIPLVLQEYNLPHAKDPNDESRIAMFQDVSPTVGQALRAHDCAGCQSMHGSANT